DLPLPGEQPVGDVDGVGAVQIHAEVGGDPAGERGDPGGDDRQPHPGRAERVAGGGDAVVVLDLGDHLVEQPRLLATEVGDLLDQEPLAVEGAGAVAVP